MRCLIQLVRRASLSGKMRHFLVETPRKRARRPPAILGRGQVFGWVHPRVMLSQLDEAKRAIKNADVS